MAWISVLIILIAAMIALEGIGAERNFRRSIEPRQPRDWEDALLNELLSGRPR